MRTKALEFGSLFLRMKPPMWVTTEDDQRQLPELIDINSFVSGSSLQSEDQQCNL